MVRRGWSQIDVPTGWVQILRGPRPPSAQWPRAVKGGPAAAASAWQSRVRLQKPAPAVRQPGVQGSPQSGRPATEPQQRVSPEVARAAASEKVKKLEKALEAMCDEAGPVVDALRAELKRAHSAAAVPALDVQIEQCNSFITRSQRRLAELEKQRASEEERLQEAKARLERLHMEAEQFRAASGKPQPAPTQIDGTAEVQRLQQMVVELQSKLSQVGIQQELTRDNNLMRDAEHGKKRFREDYVPACVEDLVQWMSDRQKDLQEAMMSGRVQDVPRLAKLVADGGAQLKAWTAEDQSMVAT